MYVPTVLFKIAHTFLDPCRRDWKAVCSALLQRKRTEQCYEDVLLSLADEVVFAIRLQSFDAMSGASLMPCPTVRIELNSPVATAGALEYGKQHEELSRPQLHSFDGWLTT